MVLAVNWWAVLAGVVISMVSGSLWYNPKTFFPVWWKGIGKADSGQEPGTDNMAVTWILTMLASAVQALFVGLFVNWLGPVLGGVNALNGLLIGFLLWLGFIMPTYLVNKLFAGHGFTVWAIEIGNHLVNFLLFGLLFGLWH
jgi:hypothetical protein